MAVGAIDSVHPCKLRGGVGVRGERQGGYANDHGDTDLFLRTSHECDFIKINILMHRKINFRYIKRRKIVLRPLGDSD